MRIRFNALVEGPFPSEEEPDNWHPSNTHWDEQNCLVTLDVDEDTRIMKVETFEVIKQNGTD